MSSKQFLLAYSTPSGLAASSLDTRIHRASEHLAAISAAPLSCTAATDAYTGIVSWSMDGDRCEWPTISVDNDHGTVAWLHVPPLAGREGLTVSPHQLGVEVAADRIPAKDVGAPFAVIHRAIDGTLRIVNDVFGMARLFEYKFGPLTVWSSRQGLAHVFAGVAPSINESSWESMATLGWSTGGETLMGSGTQLSPHTSVIAAPGVERKSSTRQMEWLRSENERPHAELASSAREMEWVIRNAALWGSKPIADLSGGKDSRVLAAAGIRAESISAVRTVRTDHGEVATAQYLMELIGNPVEHIVAEPGIRKSEKVNLVDRLLSQQSLWEGYYLARSAIKSHFFNGLRPSSTPRLNGLGGEAMQGGSIMSPNWIAKVEAGGQEAAEARLKAMVGGPLASADHSKANITRKVAELSRNVRDLGFDAVASVDFVYNFDKMPYWSNVFGSRDILLPYYAPAMLTHIAQSFTSRQPYGSMHKELLLGLVPEWSNVPFYKPSQKTRATSFLWQDETWPKTHEFIMDNLPLAPSFDAKATIALFNDIRDDKGTVHHEAAIARILWEITFSIHIEELRKNTQTFSETV